MRVERSLSHGLRLNFWDWRILYNYKNKRWDWVLVEIHNLAETRSRHLLVEKRDSEKASGMWLFKMHRPQNHRIVSHKDHRIQNSSTQRPQNTGQFHKRPQNHRPVPHKDHRTIEQFHTKTTEPQDSSIQRPQKHRTVPHKDHRTQDSSTQRP